MPTRCQTHDAVYTTEVEDTHVLVRVDLPVPLALGDADTAVLHANLHNAMELVLAPHFRQPPEFAKGGIVSPGTAVMVGERSDCVPIFLSNDYVLPKRQTDLPGEPTS